MNISPKELNENIFKLIEDNWMLITAGDHESINTMTASFGGFGVLFFKNIAHIYIRPERYTYDFVENNDTFSLSFFSEEYREQLAYCGKVSGRDEDKIKKCNFTVKYTEESTPYFDEASITVICKKIYSQDIDPECFTDKAPFERTYYKGGLHRMYIGEILDIIIK